jgi:glycosyltransferase involved in cell wall biosynthesis
MAIATLSIVIPTFNRRETLRKVLGAYENQTAFQEILEILVVDDGSMDATGEMVSEMARESRVPIRFSSMNGGGPAAARNWGIREARGNITLFADDDILPAPNMVFEHLAWHKKYPSSSTGILGRVCWAPEVNPTPFMDWLALDGVLFAFAHLVRGQGVDFTCSYSCNMSVKTAFLRANGVFDEDFRLPAFEDVDLAFRLRKRGFRLLYNPDAVGWHYKRMSFADARRRAEITEPAFRLLQTKEAGMYLKQLEDREKSALAPAGWPRRALTSLFYKLLPLSSALLPVLDSRIPLPWAAYRMLYRYHVEMRIQNRRGPHPVGASRTAGQYMFPDSGSNDTKEVAPIDGL